MTLQLLVALTIPIFWMLILIGRWLLVRPNREGDARRALLAASALSGACVGGGYPIAWVLVRNLNAWSERGGSSFTFAGNLPPGVDEDELLVILVVGLVIFIIQAVAEVRRALR